VGEEGLNALMSDNLREAPNWGPFLAFQMRHVTASHFLLDRERASRSPNAA
jgi:hypothetical protein